MIIVKGQTFPSVERIIKFINENNITKDEILEITHGNDIGGMAIYTLFFYGDSSTQEKVPGFWG